MLVALTARGRGRGWYCPQLAHENPQRKSRWQHFSQMPTPNPDSKGHRVWVPGDRQLYKPELIQRRKNYWYLLPGYISVWIQHSVLIMTFTKCRG